MRKIILLLPFVFLQCNVSSTSSTLDTSFGSAGKVTLDFTGTEDGATGVALQTNGAIVVVGRTYVGASSDFALARYDSTGNLDSTFGTAGITTTDFGGNDEAHAVTLQSDGKILVAGVTTSGSTSQFAVARYTTLGVLDTTFSSDGKVFTQIGSSADEAFAIGVDADGSIVVAGSSNNGSSKDFAVARYETDGDLDTGFSTDGKVTFSFGSGDDIARGLAFQNDEKIVIAGSAKSGVQNNFAVARLDTAGALDTSGFGTAGKTTIDFLTSPSSSDEVAYGVRVLTGGSILLGGTMNNGTNDLLALARVTTTGVLDTSFGSSGKATLGYFDTTGAAFNVQARAMTLTSGNQPVMAGFVNPESGFEVAVSQFQTDGSKDIGFGTDGILATDVAGQADEGHGLTIQSDGKIVVVGRAFNGADYDFLLLRYN